MRRLARRDCPKHYNALALALAHAGPRMRRLDTE
jgi:hypothetical protein